MRVPMDERTDILTHWAPVGAKETIAEAESDVQINVIYGKKYGFML